MDKKDMVEGGDDNEENRKVPASAIDRILLLPAFF